ncbi:hypothetical protein [Streptomyces sp. NBC_00443]|uniref:hypothetical protein n=1 Tax=Streptomyces sp. NBC_00443 TaxID=2975743 RepID=UPI002E1EF608
MSAIAGWVDFERDLTPEAPTVRAMTAALAHRGPDGFGEWIEGHAALAHRRLALLDPEHADQPALVESESGSPVAVLTLDGSITNHVELRRELAAKGHRFTSGGDAEVALHAYLEWGAAFPERLEGLFALAVWDVRRQELLLVRDRLGVKPLCYFLTPPGWSSAPSPRRCWRIRRYGRWSTPTDCGSCSHTAASRAPGCSGAPARCCPATR